MKTQIDYVIWFCVARLGLNKNKLIGRYNIFLLWYSGISWSSVVGWKSYFRAGHKQTVKNFGIDVQDRSKTFAMIFFLTDIECWFQGRRLFQVISAPRVSNVCQPHQIFIFWISWSLAFCHQNRLLAICWEQERCPVTISLGFLWDCVTHTCRANIHITHIQTCFQTRSMLYVMYARCPHIIGIVMCPLHVFCHMPYFRLSYITRHVISTCLSWFVGAV